MKHVAMILGVIALVGSVATANLIETTMDPGTLQSITDGGWSTDDSLNTWYTFNSDWSDATGVAVRHASGWSSAFIVIPAPAAGTEMQLSLDAAKGTNLYLTLQGYASLPNITNSAPKGGAFGGVDLLGSTITGGDEDIDLDSPVSTLGPQGPWTLTMPAGQQYVGLFLRGDNGAQFDNVILTPEPASLSLIGLGAAAVLRRRR